MAALVASWGEPSFTPYRSGSRPPTTTLQQFLVLDVRLDRGAVLGLLQPLDDGGVGHTAALAHRHQTVAARHDIQLIDELTRQANASGTQRVPKCDRTTAFLPSIRPTPVITPSAGAFSPTSGRSEWANIDSSQKVPWSNRRSTRSRGHVARWCWTSTLPGPPCANGLRAAPRELFEGNPTKMQGEPLRSIGGMHIS
jgi:hypothetical protein